MLHPGWTGPLRAEPSEQGRILSLSQLPGFCSTSFLTVDSDRQIQFQFSRSRSETQQLSRSLRPEQTMSVSMHQEGLPYSDTAIFKYWPTLLETSGADDDLNANLQHP